MSTNFKYARASCSYACTDVPFLQYDKDGPRRSGPLIQHLHRLLARHGGQVNSIENLAIDLLSLACEQVSARACLCLCAAVVQPSLSGDGAHCCRRRGFCWPRARVPHLSAPRLRVAYRPCTATREHTRTQTRTEA